MNANISTLRCKLTKTEDTVCCVVRDGANIRIYGGYENRSSNLCLLSSTEYPTITAAKAAMNEIK
jgi:hypothetical protein